jgi:hypothetical protein
VRAGRFLEATAVHRARLAEPGSRIEAALVRGLATRHDQRTATPAALIDDLQGIGPAVRRRYSDGEVREIVKRASELEASTPTAGGAMTIGGVEALAAEVGIAPEVVRAAVQSVATPGAAVAVGAALKRNRWLGGPTSLLFERVVEGELPDMEWQVLVDEIRRSLRNVGQLSQFGRSFSWFATRRGSAQRDLEIAVSVRGGRTHITIQENLGPLLGGIYGGIGGGMGGGGMGPILGIFVGALNLPGVAVAVVIPVWLATVFATARTAYHYSTRRRVRELTGLADRLAALVEELVSERPALRNPERLLP